MFITDKTQLTRDLLLKTSVGENVYTGQKTVAVTNTAVALSSSQDLKNGVIIQALSGNSGSVYVGDSTVTTSNGFELQAGQATSVAIDNLSKVYVNGTAGDGVCFIAAN